MVQIERHGSALPATMFEVFEVQTASLLKIQFVNRIFPGPTFLPTLLQAR